MGFKSDKAELVRGRIELAKWILDLPETGVLDVPDPIDHKEPKLPLDAFSADERRALYNKLIAGERLALRIPTPVEPKQGDSPIWSEVMLYMQYDPSQPTCDDLYLRGGLTLVGHTGKHAKHPGLRAMLIAHRPDGDDPQRHSAYSLLRASENPAHTRWSQGSGRTCSAIIRGRGHRTGNSLYSAT
jgi:hypothetical protein